MQKHGVADHYNAVRRAGDSDPAGRMHAGVAGEQTPGDPGVFEVPGYAEGPLVVGERTTVHLMHGVSVEGVFQEA